MPRSLPAGGRALSRRKVLLTNDDGICAEGLRVLHERLLPVCDVYVLAPEENRSAVSHCFSLNRPFRMRRTGEREFSCSGSPADCVVVATRSALFGVPFDAVVSGINRGANLGTDIVYSGTAAAARQAALYGIPAIAVSLESEDGDFNFSPLAGFVAKNLEELIFLSSGELFVSLNAYSSDNYSEAVFASLSERSYNDSVTVVDAPDGFMYGFISGGELVSRGEDFDAVRAGKISVSLIRAEPLAEKRGGLRGFVF